MCIRGLSDIYSVQFIPLHPQVPLAPRYSHELTRQALKPEPLKQVLKGNKTAGDLQIDEVLPQPEILQGFSNPRTRNQEPGTRNPEPGT
jgi:hypothetical protein